MATAHIKAGMNSHEAKIEINLPVIVFQDERQYWIAHIPALDLSGYGESETEARKSLDYVLSEYFDFAIKNNTLHKDLMNHGWELAKEVVNPSLSSLLNMDPLKDIINKTNFKSTNQSIKIPAPIC